MLPQIRYYERHPGGMHRLWKDTFVRHASNRVLARDILDGWRHGALLRMEKSGAQVTVSDINEHWMSAWIAR
jgi:hypothetical protein